MNAPGPHDGLKPPPELRPPVSTFTVPKARSTRSDAQVGHGGRTPSEYAEIDIRISNRLPQSWQL